MPESITDIGPLFAIAVAAGGIGYWIGQVNSDRKSFKQSIADVSNDIRAIQKDIKAILNRLPRTFVSDASPVPPTDQREEQSSPPIAEAK